MAPWDNLAASGALIQFAVFFLIGLGFGVVLEMSGFGDSRKLAAQFYFKELTVLKVMFTAIIVAAVLIFLAAALGLLDFDRLWVNPTYLAPGIVGGLIMGVGFIIGGFCPGTSLVAAATGKLDGAFFVLGVLFGVFLFGEVIGSFGDFYNSSHMGRFTLPDWLGLSYGWVVLFLVLMAVAMFYAAEIAEEIVDQGKSWREVRWLPSSRAKLAATSLIVFASLAIVLLDVPTGEAKWDLISRNESSKLSSRAVYVHPLEVAGLFQDRNLHLRVFDVREESEYNLFHLAQTEHVQLKELNDPAVASRLISGPENTVFLAVSNGESRATEAWKLLRASGAVNAYILEGGINNWLKFFPPGECVATRLPVTEGGDELAYRFLVAVGDRIPAARPLSLRTETAIECTGVAPGVIPHRYTQKVRLARKQAVKGGCG